MDWTPDNHLSHKVSALLLGRILRLFLTSVCYLDSAMDKIPHLTGSAVREVSSCKATISTV